MSRASVARRVRAAYDRKMSRRSVHDLYEHSGFYNWGYWTPETTGQAQASADLVERLLSFLPPDIEGTILDVACGRAASTDLLRRNLPDRRIVGIDLSAGNLARGQARSPSGRFACMQAERLGFRDGSFDVVLCVEAAFHFDTREDFFREAFRILRPGGRLLLADVLFARWAQRLNPGLHTSNWLPDLDAYRALLLRCGFCEAKVVDVGRECRTGHYRYRLRYCLERLRRRRLGVSAAHNVLVRGLTHFLASRHYLLACAVRDRPRTVSGAPREGPRSRPGTSSA